jgi:DNA-binding beta-propeller fold protein YncE
MKKPLTSFLIAGLMTVVVHGQAPSSTWSIAKEIHVGGDGGWDYLATDVPGQRLFVTHGNHVLALDLKTGNVVGSLDSARAHGVAFAPDLKRGFISNGDSGKITLFDLQTLKPIQSVKVGENPDAICYEPATKHVFVFNGRSRTVSVVDPVTGSVVGGFPVPGKPEFAQVDGSGFVFDNIEDKGLVLKIDAAKMAIVAQWSLPTGSEPSGLAIDAAHHRLFSACGDKKLHVLDSDTGKVIATLPIGEGVDAVAFDPVNQHVFASCGDGTLTVIKEESPDQYSVEAQVKTEPGARTMAFDSATQTAYLSCASFGPAPAPTAEHPHPRPSPLPDSFKLLVVKP